MTDLGSMQIRILKETKSKCCNDKQKNRANRLKTDIF